MRRKTQNYYVMNSSDENNSGSKGNGGDNSANEILLFFLNELQVLYCSEKMLTRVLPKIEKVAGAALLKKAIRHQTDETARHVSQLESILATLTITSQDEIICDSMAGILKDTGRLIEVAKDNSVRDIGVISSLLKIGKYKIATYGVVMSLTSVTNNDKIKIPLQEIYLNEHRAVDLLKQVMEVLVKSKNSGFDVSGALDQ